ncbi:hypothetical protein LZ32DRAFT_664281 [Colletotrichum eremochloae]|nr:hypothetical protein LZ32DRAFT_664281 [Colletotrichum eremochloae]
MPATKKTKEKVADSWEDEDVDEEEEGEEDDDDKVEVDGTARPQTDGSKAPPPTPISPTYSAADQSSSPYAAVDASAPYAPSAPSVGSGNSGVRRPEKTDAVARRMIASALGVKVPRMTEEQRAYDKAVKEKERKRREEEKAAEKRRLEEAEKARAAIWED